MSKYKNVADLLDKSELYVRRIAGITGHSINTVRKVATITIEKLIVDLFSDKNLLIAFQGSELVHIINNAYQRYSINFTTLFYYARRRGKETDIKRFLSEKTDIPKNIFNALDQITIRRKGKLKKDEQ